MYPASSVFREHIMNSLLIIIRITILSILRDKVLHVLVAAGLFLFLLVPTFSLFSMRQVQELSISLSLSMISFLLLVFSTVLGSFSIWRDVEKKYVISALGTPISRVSFVFGKFIGIACFITVCSIVLGLIAYVVISTSAVQYRSDIPVRWLNVAVAIFGENLKYVLLAAVALLFSSISTSFFFPFFATVAVYFAGSASQNVFEYISGSYGDRLSPIARLIIKGIYYLIPNFSAFEYKIQAIYALGLSSTAVATMAAYFLVYTGMVLILAVWFFSWRELS